MSKAVITGIGLVTAAGIGKENFFAAVKTHKSCISCESKLIEITKYYCRQVGEIKEIEGKKDRAYQILKIALDEALKDAKLEKEELVSTPTEVIVATAHGPLSDWEYWMDTKENVNFLSSADLAKKISADLGIEKYKVVSTACTSSTIALGIAAVNVKTLKSNITIVCGVDVLTEFIFAGFASLKALTRSVCRPFDRNRDGLVLGEGAGVVIVENLAHAYRRGAKIYCEISSFSATSDAEHFTAPSLTGEGVYRCIKNALDKVGLNPQEVSYINAHGTGTVHNDRAECFAIKKLFGLYAYEVPISSIKPIIGHTSGACGIIEVALSALCIKDSFVPANLNFETPEKGFEFNFVTKGYKQSLNCVVCVNLGFGGSNACCVLTKI